ncbi:hypothetical protein A3Q56_06851 [Intoshia linei]|uniref:RNA polymerase-associated protein LEO1 n=1 Tax=Intoshia linei TaxID=1819745 RepID=A0A177ATT8_9BILA|nr:hypothetical protein A3Q56_06851 [Intoshia linei]
MSINTTSDESSLCSDLEEFKNGVNMTLDEELNVTSSESEHEVKVNETEQDCDKVNFDQDIQFKVVEEESFPENENINVNKENSQDSQSENDTTKEQDENACVESDKLAENDTHEALKHYFSSSEEECEETTKIKDINTTIPRIKPDYGNNLYVIKLPAFLGIETKPFDAYTYVNEVDENELTNDEGCAKIKLKVENTIRWRKNPNAKYEMESNAKVVKWSDNSSTLHIGSEIFEVHDMPLQVDNCYIYIQNGEGLTAQRVLKRKLNFRPHSTDSFTYRKAISIADRSKKQQKMKVLNVVGSNPEFERAEKMKEEYEILRNANKSRQPEKYDRSKKKMARQFLESGDTYLETSKTKKSKQDDFIDDDYTSEDNDALESIKNKVNDSLSENSDIEIKTKKRTALSDSESVTSSD